MNERTGKVQTVRGLIDPSDLGPTLMHEHVLCDFTPLARRPEAAVEIALENRWQMDLDWLDAPGNRWLLDRNVAVREMQRMAGDGGRSVVEVSIPGMVVDPEGLRAVSEQTGVHIVRGCGRYVQEFMAPDDLQRGVDDLIADILREVEEGFGETAVRAGIIGEIGCSWPWTEAERRSMQAAIVAQQEIGTALTIHPGRNPQSPFEIIAFVKQAGGNPARTIMDHIERRIFVLDDILRLADHGCVMEFDIFGWETSHFTQDRDVDLASDGARITAIRALIDAGHLARVVIAQDICSRTRQAEFGGHGYGHIYRNIVPAMRRRGFTEGEIRAILVDNPARLLAFA